ncbi:MAG: 3-deoxy-manno-octulosonate cytidylyltransferase [Rhodospirillales bacterium]|nr:3-deoxy-manno-octulosonate cytidylyltransferase [Rhodospirillales bacterium]MCB9996393.1 3-deoxy-manno-octulosonate cytidylyltransferase [Rhodospirillales bacterium]
MKTAIIIPARYGSTRFPGKPLTRIAGQTMLQRVVEVGREAAAAHDNITLAVATEDQRIADHCAEIDVLCFMTSPDCPTGSDRVLEAAELAGGNFDFILSLQGDAPFTPADAIRKMLDAVTNDPSIEVITPVVRLRWTELDALRESKKITPFSGTTAIIDENGKALWFSKNIIPAIRKEDTLRTQNGFSPVHQHLGLYGYRSDILKRYVTLPQSPYEQLEGLEQLRLLENGIAIQTVTLEVADGLAQAGIDSPEDVARAEALLQR